jgi:CHAD domain-containing protein
LRYGSEFFESLLLSKSARKRFEAFIDALKEIQQILGEHNDEVAAVDFLARLALEVPPENRGDLVSAVETARILAAASSTMPIAQFLRKSRRAFRDLAETKPFWSKVADSAKVHRAIQTGPLSADSG